jgi:lipopolysaccharide/colanic/teichoic acid biosynthesis glycosyltransferase
MNLRRFSDILIALPLLFICLPALVLASVALWLELSAFPLTRVERLTREGRIVRLYRLRTTGVDGRRAAIGEVLHRQHVDLVPQLLNVVNGDLPFVGRIPSPDDGIDVKSLLRPREL